MLLCLQLQSDLPLRRQGGFIAGAPADGTSSEPQTPGKAAELSASSREEGWDPQAGASQTGGGEQAWETGAHWLRDVGWALGWTSGRAIVNLTSVPYRRILFF